MSGSENDINQVIPDKIRIEANNQYKFNSTSVIKYPLKSENGVFSKRGKSIEIVNQNGAKLDIEA